MAELKHDNHEGITFELVDGELRVKVFSLPTGGEDGDVLVKASSEDGDAEWTASAGAGGAPEVDVVADSATRTVTADDHGKLLFIDQTGSIEVELPDDLDDDTQVGLVGRSGGVTFDAQGITTLVPSGYEVGDGLFAVSLLYRDDTWFAIGPESPETPDTVTVVYDNGWPASRPTATHVLAVGGESEPSWLTSDDVWLEDVSGS